MERFMIARAMLDAGLPGKAAAEIEQIHSMYDEWRAYYGIQSVTSYYYLGLAYEQMGQSEKAIANYSEFLNLWKNAEPGLEKLDDARQRLARLQHQS